MTSLLQERESYIDSENSYARLRFLAIAVLIVCSVVFSARFAVADDSERPFKAAFTALPAGGDLVVGNGIATHLGEFDLVFFRMLDGDPSPIDSCVGFEYMFAVLTAANGDELWMNYTSGELCFDFTNFPVVVTFAGAVNLVGAGGTGRFSDSTGEYELNWGGEISADGVINSGEFEGVLGY